MASAIVQSQRTDGQEDEDSGLDDAVWDALQDSDEEPDSPQSKRSRHSLDGGHDQKTPAGIASLPSELLLRVLSFLSAEDLTASVAPSCRAFRAAADDATSWRPLFAVRWGGTQGTNSSNMDNLSWKTRYMERDRLELEEIRRRIRPPMQQYYLQMTVGRRSEVPKTPSREGSSLAEPGAGRSLAAWRAARGFRPWPLTVDHGCPGRQTFVPLPGSELPVFLCERCGWAHLCDDTCKERIVDAATDMLVCPISGFCSGRVLTEDEEAAQLRGRGDDELEPLYGTGWLARVYIDGYHGTMIDGYNG
jgi:hypothetical protein